MTGGNRVARAFALLCVAVGAVLLGFYAYRAVGVTRDLTSPASLAGTRGAYLHYECLEQAFRRLVPDGAKVYVDMEGMPAFTAFSAAFPDRVVVGSAGEADLVFGYVDPALSDPCAPGTFRALPRASAQ